MNPGRRRATVVIALIVVCSTLAGAAIERTIFQRMIRHRPGGPGPGRGTRTQDSTRRVDMLDRMTKDLNLSAAQRLGLDSVMQRSDSSLRAIRAEMQPRLQKVLEGSRAEIEARLDADQRAKFEKGGPPQRRLRRP